MRNEFHTSQKNTPCFSKFVFRENGFQHARRNFTFQSRLAFLKKKHRSFQIKIVFFQKLSLLLDSPRQFSTGQVRAGLVRGKVEALISFIRNFRDFHAKQVSYFALAKLAFIIRNETILREVGLLNKKIVSYNLKLSSFKSRSLLLNLKDEKVKLRNKTSQNIFFVLYSVSRKPSTHFFFSYFRIFSVLPNDQSTTKKSPVSYSFVTCETFKKYETVNPSTNACPDIKDLTSY